MSPPTTFITVLGFIFDLFNIVTHLSDYIFRMLVLVEGWEHTRIRVMLLPVWFTNTAIACVFSSHLEKEHFREAFSRLSDCGVWTVRVPVVLFGMILGPIYAVVDYFLYTTSCCSTSTSSSSTTNAGESSAAINHRERISINSGKKEKPVTITSAQTLRESAVSRQNTLSILDQAIAARAYTSFLGLNIVAACNIVFVLWLTIVIAVQDETASTVQVLSLTCSLLNILLKSFQLCRSAIIGASLAKFFFICTDTLRIPFTILALFEASAPNEVRLFGSSSAMVTYLMYVWLFSKLIFVSVSFVTNTIYVYVRDRHFRGNYCGTFYTLFGGVWLIIPSVIMDEFMNLLFSFVPDFTLGHKNAFTEKFDHLTLLHEFLWSRGSNKEVAKVIDWEGTFQNLLRVSASGKSSSNDDDKNHDEILCLLQPIFATPSSSDTKITFWSDSFMCRACHFFLMGSLISLHEKIPEESFNVKPNGQQLLNVRTAVEDFIQRDSNLHTFIKYDDTVQIYVEEEKGVWDFLDFFKVSCQLGLQLDFVSKAIAELVYRKSFVVCWVLAVYSCINRSFVQLFPLLYAIFYFETFTTLMKVLWFAWLPCFILSFFACGPGFVKYYMTVQVYETLVQKFGKAHAESAANMAVESYFWVPVEMMLCRSDVIPDSIIPGDALRNHTASFLHQSHVPVSKESFEEFQRSESIIVRPKRPPPQHKAVQAQSDRVANTVLFRRKGRAILSDSIEEKMQSLLVDVSDL